MATTDAPGEVLAPTPQNTPTLGRGTRRVLTALARAAMPAGEHLPAPDEEVAERVERFFAGTPAVGRLGYRLLILVVQLGSLLSTLRPLTRLTPERAQAFVERWSASRSFIRRGILRAVLTPIKVAHYASPEMCARVGYVPEPPSAPVPLPRCYAEQMAAAEEHAGEVIDAEVVVVGSGPGGAVMASRLAEAGVAVVLLEEGEHYRRQDFTRRPFQMSQLMYRDGGMTVALGVPGIPVPIGRTVGGTSTINSGTCYRVPGHVLESWREEHHLSHLTPEHLAPHYDELERFLKVQPVADAVKGKVAEVIARGCEALGYSHHPLMRNAEGCEGSGVCCFGCPTGAKQSMDLSFVPRALERGVRLFTGARVETILREGRRATGVVARTASGGALTVKASAVVLACGSLATPVLLMKNGLAGASGALGNNLTIHPAAKCGALFDEEIRLWEGVPQAHTIDHFHDEGLLFEGASVPPDYGAMALAQVGSRFTEIMEQYAHLAFFGFLIEDSGTGKVRPGPGGSLRIQYSANQQDVERLKRGTQILAEVFFAAGARKVFTPVAGVDELEDAREIERLKASDIRAKHFELSAFHPLGTCRMSVGPERGVIDPGLEHWDLDGLFVSDGSIFPSSLVVNPQMTIMAMASDGARNVADRLGGAGRWGTH
ncbi:MAG: GMC family oxidoreductase [Deltaproteobacteria bacterium]|nr:GMC family oxidoreductase [Deltaproteobacteria bacterium]